MNEMKQIRLLLPQNLIDQLNLVSKNKTMSRLALIRCYIRSSLVSDIGVIGATGHQISNVDSTPIAVLKAFSEKSNEL